MNNKKLSGSAEESNVHVKIDFHQAVNTKKQLLIGEIDVLKLIKGINSFSQMRRKELELREDLKKESGELHELVRLFLRNMPKIQDEDRTKIKEDLASINRREVIESDLDSIREKLGRLGGI
ncbi:MAG: hypothetical protein AABW73_04350 [Nanoarchaeota archaeon]